MLSSVFCFCYKSQAQWIHNNDIPNLGIGARIFHPSYWILWESVTIDMSRLLEILLCGLFTSISNSSFGSIWIYNLICLCVMWLNLWLWNGIARELTSRWVSLAAELKIPDLKVALSYHHLMDYLRLGNESDTAQLLINLKKDQFWQADFRWVTLLRTIQRESVELNSAVRREETIVQADQLRPAEPGPTAIPRLIGKLCLGCASFHSHHHRLNAPK